MVFLPPKSSVLQRLYCPIRTRTSLNKLTLTDEGIRRTGGKLDMIKEAYRSKVENEELARYPHLKLIFALEPDSSVVIGVWLTQDLS